MGWWSKWAKAVWVTEDCYVLLSDEFDEPFFNRAGLLAPGHDPADLIARVEAEFARVGKKPHLLVQESSEYDGVAGMLSKRRYEGVDEMSVMELVVPSLVKNPEIQVRPVNARDEVDSWCRTYLTSFYGDVRLFRPLARIGGQIAEREDVSLVTAYYRGLPVGTLAIFRGAEVNGVYCVGTIPEYRRRGVASAMLDYAYEDSRNNHSRLILQTMLSDAVEAFYTRLGFRRLYLKRLLRSP